VGVQGSDCLGRQFFIATVDSTPAKEILKSPLFGESQTAAIFAIGQLFEAVKFLMFDSPPTLTVRHLQAEKITDPFEDGAGIPFHRFVGDQKDAIARLH